MFNNPDFYPTPTEVIQQITVDLYLYGKTVLEPSAGSGNILYYLRDQGAQTLACEKDPTLAEITKTKCDRFLCPDFMDVTSEQVSHIDYIVMNPPFSRDEKHILHAWSIAPEGCTIKALCNWETIDNQYSRNRRELAQIISKHGQSENLGDCFSNSERKTGVEIGLVTLFKPKTGDNEFNDFFDLTEDYQPQENGLIGYNEIQDIVSRYVGAVKMYDEVMMVSNKINGLTEPFGYNNEIKFGAFTTRNNHHTNITREVFKKELQKSAWKTVFRKMDMGKYVTKSVLEKLNSFVEKQTQVPFKLQNVYRMVDMIVQTYSQNMDQAIIEVFEKITSHYHENRFEVEGWKTNSQYMINKKIILPGVSSNHWGDFGIVYDSYNVLLINDLCKSLCYITGQPYTNIYDLHLWGRSNDFSPGKWYDWGFFEIKGFKKGTLHMKFKNRDHWALLNQRIAKLKGWGLPEKFK